MVSLWTRAYRAIAVPISWRDCAEIASGQGRKRLHGAGTVEVLEARRLLAGVTLITHGYEPVSSARPSWLDYMAVAVEARVGQLLPIYALRITDNLTTTITRLNTTGPTGPSDSTDTSGEVIVLLDWADASGLSGIFSTYHQTTEIASIAANALASAYPSVGITQPLAELPIHLMGHSRGGSVVSELSRILGEKGIAVDEQTTWDPHPVAPDPVARVYENTLFADNYYETDNTNLTELFVTGTSVQGAHNVLLDGLSVGHGGTHTFYYGTIDTGATTDGDASVRGPWYNTAATGPRDSVGFAWSRIGNGTQPADGSLFEGAFRSPISVTATGSALWDNVLVDSLASDATVPQGHNVPLQLQVDDVNSDASVWIGVDSDANPYDGVSWVWSGATGDIATATWQTTLNTSTMSPGTYHVCAAIGNGTNTRYDYSRATLTVTDSTPKDITLSATSVAENQPAGTVVGTLSATDPDAGDTATFSLITGKGAFQIVGNQIKTLAPLNYEVKNSYSVTVQATDSGGLSFQKTFTVSVTNVNEAPTNIALSNATVAENRPAGTVVGTLSATDPDAGDTVTYSLLTGKGAFQIVGNQLKTVTVLNSRVKSSYAVTVRVTDAGGLTYDKAFTVNVIANRAPIGIALTKTTIRQNLPAGTLVGTLSATDPDAGETFTYSLITGNGAFQILGNRVTTLKALSYRLKSSYLLTVRVTDLGGLTFDKAFTVNVTV